MAIQIRPIICGDIQEVAYLVYDDARTDCVLVDPGDDCAALSAALGDRTLSAMLLTHGHFDHVLAAGRLQRDTGAPVYVSEGDAAMVNDPAVNGLQFLMGVNEMPGPEIALTLYGDALSVAGLTFQVLPTPGHSRGSVCLYLEDAGIMFSGDTLFCAGFGRMDLYGGSPRQMRESLRALFKLPPETRVYPGHGSGTTIGDEMRRYRL